MILSRFLLALSTPLLLATSIQAQETADESDMAGSPMEAYEAQRNAILEAETLDDVMDYLPEYVKPRVADMSEEQRAAGLAEWKNEIRSDRAPRPIRELVGETRGVIWMESGEGVRMTIMVLEGRQWTMTGEVILQEAVPGARGGFTASGAVEHEVEKGIVQLTHLNGVPLMTVSDPLRKHLEERDVPVVQLAIESCLGTGTHPLEPIEGGNAIIGSRYTHVSPDGSESEIVRAEGLGFYKNVTGSLGVESVEGDRFDGTFQFRAETDGGEGVTVEGWVQNAMLPCDGDAS